MRASQMRVAIHEAGHVVVATVFGFRPRAAIRGVPSPRTTYGVPLKIRDSCDEERVAMAAVNWAGVEAELLTRLRLPGDYADLDSDLEQIEAIAHFARDPSVVEVGRAIARSILVARLESVRRVAAVLEQSGKISESQILVLMSG